MLKSGGNAGVPLSLGAVRGSIHELQESSGAKKGRDESGRVDDIEDNS
jgi:hypothetical protein